jgi:hypothetical protein
VFNGEAYLTTCGGNGNGKSLYKFNANNDTWLPVTNVPFNSEGNSIIPTPTETYFGFGVGGDTAELGIMHSNMWSSLKFEANVSDAEGLFETNYSNFSAINCSIGSLTNGSKYSIYDEDGDLFVTVEAQPSANIGGPCMEVSSVALTSPFETDAANYGNGFTENAMFLNKNLLLKSTGALGQGATVRLYYTQTELQKLIIDFNATYNLNKTISDIKIVRYFDNFSNSDHEISNNNSATGYSVLTATLNTYGADYYFEVDAAGTNTIIGEVRAALLTGQDLGMKNPTIKELTLYPNPTHSILNIQTDKTIEEVAIIDFCGRTANVKLAANNTIDVSTFSNGIYFILIKTTEGFFREKFIKN